MQKTDYLWYNLACVKGYNWDMHCVSAFQVVCVLPAVEQFLYVWK